MTLPFYRRLYTSAVCTLILAVSSPIAALAQSTFPKDLATISLEELMNVEVTSVSKKEQKLSGVGAAAYVITQEDIRRSGMTNIPDLLRMVPGVNVARIAANIWAISIRGFNDRYSTKVLVLIDGRSVYTNEFAGVQWDQLSVPLEDIDRIEVIRGPGGTVWGANAVNGVINIITKDSRRTQGGLVSAGAGSQDSAQGLVRYGGKVGNAGSYRVFGRYFDVRSALNADGGRGVDGWHGFQGGFRTDWDLSSKDALTVQGDLYQTREGQKVTTVLSRDRFQTLTFNDRIRVESGNLLGRWTHTFSNGSEASVQTFFSDVVRIDQGTDDQDTADVEFQYRFKLGRHDVLSGVGYRHSTLLYNGLYNYRYDEAHHTSTLFNTFVQDEVRLTKNIA